jgi:hypothetical protein
MRFTHQGHLHPHLPANVLPLSEYNHSAMRGMTALVGQAFRNYLKIESTCLTSCGAGMCGKESEMLTP